MEQGIRIRTVILLWLLFSGVSGIQAQSAGDIDTLSQWRIDETYGEPQWMHYDHFKYYISGTIMINSRQYYKVNKSGYWYVNNPNYPNYYDGYYAPLREGNNKWFTTDYDDEDVLLYDYTLNVGDTIDSYANGMGEIITIVSIDTILIDGEAKKRFHLSCDFGAKYIIEDIGAYTGLFEPLTWFENVSDFYCYAVDFVPIWINPDYSPYCDLSVSIMEVNQTENLSSHPNPFTTSTTIKYELKEISNIQFTIYNVIGEVVYATEDRLMPQGSHTVTWSPSHLPEGMYYAVLRSEEGVGVVKMVKQ